VCTDRGQHPESSFGVVPVWPGASGWEAGNPRLTIEEYADVETSLADVLAGGEAQLSRTYPLRCRRCERNVPMRQSTLAGFAVRLAATESDTLDISFIPS
jgi:hypothetical protein